MIRKVISCSHWLPALCRVPNDWLVDLESATQQAKAAIVKKHGSRKQPSRRRKSKPADGDWIQTQLEF